MTADLDRIVSLADFEPIARTSMDPAAYDYVAGGSWDEQTLAENVEAWRRHRFRPRVLVDVSAIDLGTTLLGMPSALPIATAPMALHRLSHPDGEMASARAAAASGVPFTLSTTASCTIEEVAEAAPTSTRWFQLYAQIDPGVTRSLVDRAVASGYRAIMLTVDLPMLGYRDRDRRSRFVIPPLANFRSDPAPGERPATDATQDHDRGLTWADVDTIRGWSDLPLVLKGILTAEDAELAIAHGVDGIVVSNHGARQLDRVQATADALGPIVDAVAGRTEVLVDGGIRRGLDVAAALALGARGVLIGRPVHWALAAGGTAGVERALAILAEELLIAFALLGVRTPGELGRQHLVARA